MNDQAKGIAALLVACSIWGLSPIFYKELAHLPPLDVLAHRTAWSLGFFLIYLGLRGSLREIPAAFRAGRFWAIGLATLMVSTNWFLFILSTQIDRVTEASLGYFIFPLFAVALGRFWFGEGLSRIQWMAVLLAMLGVIVLTLGLGVAPWLSLMLAATFSVYSGIKKTISLGPVLSVTCEVLVFMPVSVLVLVWSLALAEALPNLRDLGFLILSGPLTAGPLLLFSYAARRSSMVAVGLLQFINPTLQFFCAVVLFAEPFTDWHSASFALIWMALGLYAVSLVRQQKAARKRSTASLTETATTNSSFSDGSAKP